MKTDSDVAVAKRLRLIADTSPELAGIARVYEAVLPLLRNVVIETGAVPLNPEQARAKMGKGLPILRGLGIEIDSSAVGRLMLLLVQAAEDAGNAPQSRTDVPRELCSSAGRIRAAIEENVLAIDAILPYVASGEKGPVADEAGRLGLDPELLWMLGRHALRPAFHALHRQVKPLTDGADWTQGFCFICGSRPNFGELRGNAQELHLRCVECGADWPFRRLLCSHCGNEDHRTLGFLYAEGHRDKHRVDVCEKCRGYLKIIMSFEPTTPEMLQVEDLATLHLDYCAGARGYRRPEAQAFREKPGCPAETV